MSDKTRIKLSSTFKMHGLSLRTDAMKYLWSVISQVEPSDQEESIERLIEAIQKQSLDSTVVSRDICEAAVEACNTEADDFTDQAFTIIDGFSVPKFSYDSQRKKFMPLSASYTLYGSAADKGRLFLERYNLLHQRTLRHELFSPVVLASQKKDNKKFQLRPVEFLLGSTVKLGEIIVLGLLTQMKEGKWYIEDPTGAVQLDFSGANFHIGLFTENSFILAEGSYEDQVFHVTAVGFPPAESARTTRSVFGNVNFFGGTFPTSARAYEKLQHLETLNEDDMLVFISDSWLDNLQVQAKLKTLFTGYCDVPPTCFVFMGSFLSQTYGGKESKVLKESLHALSSMLSEFPEIVSKSKFVFVPGPQDPGMSTILPRPPLPESVTNDFSQKIPGAVFTTNPCRIRYYTQEIVIFREDLVMKMCRNCVRFPGDSDIPKHIVRSLVCQATLCPLPLHVSPVYWSHYQALQLYPLPDLLVCADKYDPYTVNYTGCTLVNPGSFPKTDWGFKVYVPSTRQVEDSRLPSDE